MSRQQTYLRSRIVTYEAELNHAKTWGCMEGEYVKYLVTCRAQLLQQLLKVQLHEFKR